MEINLIVSLRWGTLVVNVLKECYNALITFNLNSYLVLSFILIQNNHKLYRKWLCKSKILNQLVLFFGRKKFTTESLSLNYKINLNISQQSQYILSANYFMGGLHIKVGLCNNLSFTTFKK